jgi:hypothetical protein
MRIALLIICFGLVPAAAQAQTIDRNPMRASVLFEALHPLYEDDDLDITSAAYILSGRVPVGRKAAFMFDLPFAYVSLDDDLELDDETSSAVGNPLLGISVLSSNTEIQFGGRPGLADDEDLALALIRPVDAMRSEAFDPNVGTLFARVRVKQPMDRGLVWGFDLGATIWLPEDDDDDIDEADNEVSADYGVALGYVGDSARLTMRLKGRALLTDDDEAEDLDFGDRTVHQLGMYADFGSGPIRPGVAALIHLDDDYEPDTAIGLSLKFMSY